MSTSISAEELVERIMAAGIPGRAAAKRAVRALLVTFGERLMQDEVHALVAHLPEELARILDHSEYDGDFDAAELYERVRRREETSPGIAREHADVVLRVLGEAIDDDTRRRLVRGLPDPVAIRLQPSSLGRPPPHVAARRTAPLTTLAHGRPGSGNPISRSSPPFGHSSSVARNDEPHSETKLSSGRGLTQERLGETLAAGRPPGPAHPISEADDER